MAVTPSGLLGLHPSSERLSSYINFLSTLVSTPDATVPQIKSFSDAVYFNYFSLGLSLLFKPQNGYRPSTGLKRSDLKDDNLILDSIDIYNTPKITTGLRSTHVAELAFLIHPISPLILNLTPPPTSVSGSDLRLTQFSIFPDTTGKEFVKSLEEPERKGGGAGPSSGSIGIWCEWSKYGIMVEFGGDEAKGPQAWERGKDAVWRVITLFPPKLE